MRSLLLSGASFALTAAVIANAYYQKKQFYPSVVYITKSNPSMAVIYIQAFVIVILMGKLLRKIFFGQLRAAEMEHLIERSWYAVTETCLAFTVFRDDFSPRFVALFTVLLFLKCFHWMAEDRVDFMERSPVISFVFHLRVLSLLTFLGVLDVYFVNHAYYSTLLKGPTVQLVFGFEYSILLTVVAMTFIKYLLHTVDLQNENPWDNKAVYLLYTELLMGFTRVVLYVCFMVVMIKVHTFPLFAIRPMYLASRSFKKALQDVIMSRRAIRNMNTMYADATPEELASGDNVCIICREEMTQSSKKLPCNHIFHTSCLRSWFQRQQTCPTCRLDVLRMPRPSATPAAAAAATAAAPPIAQANNAPQQLFQNFNGMFGGFPYAWPPVPPAHANGQPGAQPQQGTQQSVPSAGGTTTSANNNTTPAAPGSPPPFPPFSHLCPCFPPPPANLGGLSDSELRSMEGTERANVEARIYWLRDIQALLDGAMMLISQYNQVAATVGMSGIHVPPTGSQTSTAKDTASTKTKPEGPIPETNQAETVTTNTDTLPKVSSSVTSLNSPSSKSLEETLDFSGLEGATGFSGPKEMDLPAWEDPREDEHEDELHEVRRRRLERFSQEGKKKEDFDLD
ncbi:hypothetical protein C0Q70_13213 [Pomacea canaliculata]|uniref:RING-type E3 ubiquitin transferase n=1 Tax=Pomacea canaliculata TaxID=400727 RepID=A0A2T7NWM6_POMCA|nr:hypothetical protein C0Q70_13213 [Pomacea canaliculata]